jgi:hypothetical protein
MDSILAEGVFVTQLCSNAGISVLRIVWVTANYPFMSDIIQINSEDLSPLASESKSLEDIDDRLVRFIVTVL